MRIVRFLGVVLPTKLYICQALRIVYGIGQVRALQICKLARISQHIVVSNLKNNAVTRLKRIATRSLLEPALKRRKKRVLDIHKDIGTAPGRRHRFGLPARGQRTRTNARTRKSQKKHPKKEKK